MKVLARFPSVLKMDTTFKTNREGRHLYNLVVKDSNNKLTTVLRCLLPSVKGAIFDWILQQVMTKFISKDVRDRVNIVITDGDSTEINAVRNSLLNVFPRAQHINCLWHLVNQGLKRSGLEKDLKEFLKHWCYFIIINT